MRSIYEHTLMLRVIYMRLLEECEKKLVVKRKFFQIDTNMTPENLIRPNEIYVYYIHMNLYVCIDMNVNFL